MSWNVILIRIGAAILIGTVVGVEREYKNRPAGMRTHVLVCLGACIIALIEDCLRYDLMEVSPNGAVSFTVGRITAQVVSGVGFLGAGTIFVAQKKIAGLTTAASLWNVACLGIAAGLGYYYIALTGCICVMVVLIILQRVVHVNPFKKLEIKFVHRSETLGFINDYFAEQEIATIDLDFHMDAKEGENIYTNIYTLKLPKRTTYSEIINHLAEFTNIRSIRMTNL